jgi:hypothetical protein
MHMTHPHSSNVTTVTEESCQHWATTQNCFVLTFLTNWDWNHNREKNEADLRPTKMGKSIIPWWFCRLGPPSWDMSQHLQSDLHTICQVQWGFHHRSFAPIQVPALCPSTLAIHGIGCCCIYPSLGIPNKTTLLHVPQ